MGMAIDEPGWKNIAVALASQGWRGSGKQLRDLLDNEETASKLRYLRQSWSWGEGAKEMVFGLVDCAQRRGASVMVTSDFNCGRGPKVSLSFPKKSRLQALQMQVREPGYVYVVRKFKDDWRSARDFHPRARSAKPPSLVDEATLRTDA